MGAIASRRLVLLTVISKRAHICACRTHPYEYEVGIARRGGAFGLFLLRNVW